MARFVIADLTDPRSISQEPRLDPNERWKTCLDVIPIIDGSPKAIDRWSCACYLPEIGNTAEPGTVVTWAESSAVNYGNSVLGLRINRMATGMEILCAIAGRVPVFGVLTDEGRKAKWHVDVQLTEEPHWEALGGAIGTKVVDKAPCITGIDRWIGMEDGKPDVVVGVPGDLGHCRCRGEDWCSVVLDGRLVRAASVGMVEGVLRADEGPHRQPEEASAR